LVLGALRRTHTLYGSALRTAGRVSVDLLGRRVRVYAWSYFWGLLAKASLLRIHTAIFVW
jgi:hypothetical protein